MSTPAFVFDLDGTLVDSVYQHVLAWHEALHVSGMELSVWRIHRRIGMSGGLFVNALLREMGQASVPREQADRTRRYHAEAYARLVDQVRPLPGALELLSYLKNMWGEIPEGSRYLQDGEDLFLPILTNVHTIWYRDDVYDEVPDTWDRHLEMAEENDEGEGGIRGTALMMSPEENTPQIGIYSAGWSNGGWRATAAVITGTGPSSPTPRW
jgi:hypothetical protein